jgi:glucose-6-phosphate isomerase
LNLICQKPNTDIILDFSNDANFSYLNQKSLAYVNECAYRGTVTAHTTIGKVDNLTILIGQTDEYNFGYLFI